MPERRSRKETGIAEKIERTDAEWRAALTPEQLLASPLVAIGSVGQICDKLIEVRDSFGFSCTPIPASTPVMTRPTTATAAGRRSTKRAQPPQAPSP